MKNVAGEPVALPWALDSFSATVAFHKPFHSLRETERIVRVASTFVSLFALVCKCSYAKKK